MIVLSKYFICSCATFNMTRLSHDELYNPGSCLCWQFFVSGSYHYHKTCYKESHHPKCDVCRHFVSISTHAFIIFIRSENAWAKVLFLITYHTIYIYFDDMLGAAKQSCFRMSFAVCLESDRLYGCDCRNEKDNRMHKLWLYCLWLLSCNMRIPFWCHHWKDVLAFRIMKKLSIWIFFGGRGCS